VIDCHFGHADRFRIYSLSSAGVVLVNERFTPKYCQGSDECEPQDSEARMAAIMALLADVKAVFCSRIGYGPWQQLEAQGIQPCVDDAWQPVLPTLAHWWEKARQQWQQDDCRKGWHDPSRNTTGFVACCIFIRMAKVVIPCRWGFPTPLAGDQRAHTARTVGCGFAAYVDVGADRQP
jgi:hypothetical protein